MVCPLPRQLYAPQQLDVLAQRPGTGAHQISHPQHLAEHHHKESQKTVAEPLFMQEFRWLPICRKLKFLPQQGKELSPVAEKIAVKLATAGYSDNQRQEEENQPYPGTQDIEET